VVPGNLRLSSARAECEAGSRVGESASGSENGSESASGNALASGHGCWSSTQSGSWTLGRGGVEEGVGHERVVADADLEPALGTGHRALCST